MHTCIYMLYVYKCICVYKCTCYVCTCSVHMCVDIPICAEASVNVHTPVLSSADLSHAHTCVGPAGDRQSSSLMRRVPPAHRFPSAGMEVTCAGASPQLCPPRPCCPRTAPQAGAGTVPLWSPRGRCGPPGGTCLHVV